MNDKINYERGEKMELIDIVNENNEFTGQIEEREIAYEKGLWRRTVSCWIMNEKGELYVKNFIIYEINMDYYDKIWYSKNEEEIKKNQYMIMLDLDKKELENMPKDKIVDKYITNVTIVNDDPEFQKYMSEEEDKKKIQNSLLSEAKEEGISQGISQGYTSGINDGIKQTAKNLLSMNVTLEDISKATGLSIEEINKLK